MRSWNHRVMEHKGLNNEKFYAIHEVYYEDDVVESWTLGEEGMAPFGDTAEELTSDLHHMIEAAKKPILSFETGKEVVS